MSNFSRKNALQIPPAPETFSTIIGAVEVMCAITQQLYKPVVHDTLVAAANFLGELRVSDLPVSSESLAEIAAWIDDQLELFRVFVTEEKLHGIQQIKEPFSVSHESFIRVHQRILRQDVIAAVKLASTSSNGRNHQTRGERNPNSEKRVTIPIEVRQVLPKQGNRPICLRYLSAQGCRGKNGNCVIKNLCHFKPATLPEIARDFIVKNYGGLASDME
ncbi:hypothetical protein PF008_g17594 [Phytophthora fragariae]|uniref:Uncharacterized protein n=1 Tax=Phytophthora fragariae TaxID=53985 RepID=A0A6G0R884_9STRA|nr:hypothetical protein PF008_g17594 [Phytophthora fragariae]